MYEGSPTIVTAYFGIAPKIGITATIIQFISIPMVGVMEVIQPIIIISGIISVLVGSIGAINQTKFKRLIAYSAIGHTGFIILGVGTGAAIGVQAAMVYLVIYIILSINIFASALTIFDNAPAEENYITILSGLSRANPIMAITMAMCLLALAGVPPLAGFFSKYMVIIALIQEGFNIVATISILASVVGAFYYLRIVSIMYFGSAPEAGKETSIFF